MMIAKNKLKYKNIYRGRLNQGRKKYELEILGIVETRRKDRGEIIIRDN